MGLVRAQPSGPRTGHVHEGCSHGDCSAHQLHVSNCGSTMTGVPQLNVQTLERPVMVRRGACVVWGIDARAPWLHELDRLAILMQGCPTVLHSLQQWIIHGLPTSWQGNSCWDMAFATWQA